MQQNDEVLITAESNDMMDEQAINFYKQIRESESIQYLPDGQDADIVEQ